jgi:hypothetical protein
MATWTEISKMTIDDVDLQNMALDSWREAEIRAHKNASR